MLMNGNQVAYQLKRPIEFYHRWAYKNTTLLVISLLLFWYFAGSDAVKHAIELAGGLGYVGALLTGLFLVSTFTIAPALAVLYHLADILNPLEIAILAGVGGVAGDYIIFRYLKDRIFTELKPVFHHFGGPYLSGVFKTPYFAWLTPIVGAALIASPLPDEVGIGLLGVSKLRNWQFILLSFFLNATGIFIVVTLARSF